MEPAAQLTDLPLAPRRVIDLPALGWALLLEAGVLASLAAAAALDAEAGEASSALTLLLTLLQLPGWLVATACFFPSGAATGPPDMTFLAIMGITNLPVLYAVMRSAHAGGLAATWGKPYPHAMPTFLLAALVPMYMAIAMWTPLDGLARPEWPADRALPLQPAWVVVYASQWVFSFLPIFIVRGVELRRRAVWAYLSIVVVAYAGFLLYPTIGPRPAEVAGGGIFAWGLQAVYAIDPPYNCFPSLHVAYSFLAALTAYCIHRGLGLAALGWAFVIALSTVFTKQHYVADVAAGIAMAFTAYAVFLRNLPAHAVPEQARKLAPVRALAVPGIFAVMLAYAWVAFDG